MAGGGPLLTDVVEHDPDRHTADNAARAGRGRVPGRAARTPRRRRCRRLPARRARRRAPARARELIGPHARYIVVHASGGRAIKQWDVDRFAAATHGDRARARGRGRPERRAGRRAADRAGPGRAARRHRDRRPDRPARSAGARRGPRRRAPASSPATPGRCTSPPRCGTPVVAVFGPSMPVRYAPRSTRASRRPHRPVVRAVQPDPQAAGALPGPHARLPGRRHRRRGRRGRAVARRRDRAGARRRAGDARVIGRLAIERAGRVDTIDLDDYGAGAIADEAAGRANAWIKSLRHVDVAGRSLRDRFHYRGDSLWWFAELFLHKEGVVDALWRTALTLDARLRGRGADARSASSTAARRCALLLPQVAARLGHRPAARAPTRAAAPALARDAATGVKSRAADVGGRGAAGAAGAPAGARDRRHAGVRAQRVLARRDRRGGLHRAGARRARRDAARPPIQLVGVGPRRNFQARRWWHPLMPGWRQPRGDGAVVPVETLASRAALAGSRAVWRARHDVARALTGSAALRAAARVARLRRLADRSRRAARHRARCSSRGRRARWTKPARRSTRCRPRAGR